MSTELLTAERDRQVQIEELRGQITRTTEEIARHAIRREPVPGFLLTVLKLYVDDLAEAVAQ